MGETHVELDELPLLGRFVEIEAPNEAALEATERDLQLTSEPIKDHYVAMACEALDAGSLNRGLSVAPGQAYPSEPIGSPDADVVSIIPSEIERKPMPRSLSSSIMLTRSVFFRT